MVRHIADHQDTSQIRQNKQFAGRRIYRSRNTLQLAKRMSAPLYYR